jgi:hypothetical protein
MFRSMNDHEDQRGHVYSGHSGGLGVVYRERNLTPFQEVGFWNVSPFSEYLTERTLSENPEGEDHHERQNGGDAHGNIGRKRPAQAAPPDARRQVGGFDFRMCACYHAISRSHGLPQSRRAAPVVETETSPNRPHGHIAIGMANANADCGRISTATLTPPSALARLHRHQLGDGDLRRNPLEVRKATLASVLPRQRRLAAKRAS